MAGKRVPVINGVRIDDELKAEALDGRISIRCAVDACDRCSGRRVAMNGAKVRCEHFCHAGK